MAGRGELTPEINAKAKELFGYEIDLRALRLIPYILYVLPNGGEHGGKIEREKINDDDRYWLKRWTDEKRINWGAPWLRVTKEFYDAACELQWMGYINNHNQELKKDGSSN